MLVQILSNISKELCSRRLQDRFIGARLYLTGYLTKGSDPEFNSDARIILVVVEILKFTLTCVKNSYEVTCWRLNQLYKLIITHPQITVTW